MTIVGLVPNLPSETVNSRFNENKAVFTVPVLPVCLKVLADSDGFLNKVP